MSDPSQDAAFMALALEEARGAARAGEVPVGAVLVVEERVIARGANAREGAHDPTAHAEIIALRAGAGILGRWRLTDATLYVTLEPCAMCAGALVNARVGRLVYAADDPKAGAVRSLFRIADDPRLNHRVVVEPGVAAAEAAELLRKFFQARR